MPTKIEWTNETWNPATGCTKVSAGCRNCYAERMSKRLRGRCGYPADDPFRVTLHPDRLAQPLRWRKPRRVFVCSMGDLFHEDVPDEFIAAIFAMMNIASKHTFQVLTKRPERMCSWLRRCADSGIDLGWITHNGTEPISYGGTGIVVSSVDHWPLPNVQLGTSVEDQATANERLLHLLSCPAAVRFVSCEPLLASVDLGPWLPENDPIETTGGGEFDPRSLDSVLSHMVGGPVSATGIKGTKQVLDWVIVGGESGPGARPMHPDWARSLRDQCQAAGVPFFFKQWGAWQPQEHGYYGDVFMDPDGAYAAIPEGVDCSPMSERLVAIRKVGKKLAGRLLDGHEWSEMPGDSRGTE